VKITADELTAAAWSAALAEVPKPVDIVPPGWLTSEQIAQQTKTNINSLRRQLPLLIKAGRCEMRVFRVLASRSKQLRRVPHYRLK
jgi:hypothetical protein